MPVLDQEKKKTAYFLTLSFYLYLLHRLSLIQGEDNVYKNLKETMLIHIFKKAQSPIQRGYSNCIMNEFFRNEDV